MGAQAQEKGQMSARYCKYRVKIILLGKQRVGKTSILRKFAFNRFDANNPSTMAVDRVDTVVHTNNGDAVFLEIWDTVGQEKYNSLTNQFFRNAHCFDCI